MIDSDSERVDVGPDDVGEVSEVLEPEATPEAPPKRWDEEARKAADAGDLEGFAAALVELGIPLVGSDRAHLGEFVVDEAACKRGQGPGAQLATMLASVGKLGDRPWRGVRLRLLVQVEAVGPPAAAAAEGGGS